MSRDESVSSDAQRDSEWARFVNRGLAGAVFILVGLLTLGGISPISIPEIVGVPLIFAGIGLMGWAP